MRGRSIRRGLIQRVGVGLGSISIGRDFRSFAYLHIGFYPPFFLHFDPVLWCPFVKEKVVLGAILIPGACSFPGCFIILAVCSDVLDEIGVAFVDDFPDVWGQVIESEDADPAPLVVIPNPHSRHRRGRARPSPVVFIPQIKVQAFSIDLGYAGGGAVPAVVFANQDHLTSGYHGVGPWGV